MTTIEKSTTLPKFFYFLTFFTLVSLAQCMLKGNLPAKAFGIGQKNMKRNDDDIFLKMNMLNERTNYNFIINRKSIGGTNYADQIKIKLNRVSNEEATSAFLSKQTRATPSVVPTNYNPNRGNAESSYSRKNSYSNEKKVPSDRDEKLKKIINKYHGENESRFGYGRKNSGNYGKQPTTNYVDRYESQNSRLSTKSSSRFRSPEESITTKPTQSKYNVPKRYGIASKAKLTDPSKVAPSSTIRNKANPSKYSTPPTKTDMKSVSKPASSRAYNANKYSNETKDRKPNFDNTRNKFESTMKKKEEPKTSNYSRKNVPATNFGPKKLDRGIASKANNTNSKDTLDSSGSSNKTSFDSNKKTAPRYGVNKNSPSVMTVKKNSPQPSKFESKNVNTRETKPWASKPSNASSLQSTTKVNTREDQNFEKINIVWDQSILKKNLRDLGKSHMLDKIMDLVVHVDSALKKYIKIKKSADKTISIPKNFTGCQNKEDPSFDSKNFTQPLSTTGDLFIFLSAVWDDNTVRASAAPCEKNANNRTYIGKLIFNLKNLSFEYSHYHLKNQDINTVFHETLHIMAFHSYIFENLIGKVKEYAIPQKFNHLMSLIAIRGDPLLNDAHWNETYIPNDIMISFSLVNNIPSIYTLEYLDLVSDEIKTQRENLPNNFLLDEISDIRDFFNYQCPETDTKSKYSAFCTKKEAQKGGSTCTRDRLYRAGCQKTILENNCVQKTAYPNYLCTNPNNTTNSKFESFGRNSRCINAEGSSGTPKSLCLNVEVKGKTLLIRAANSEYECTHAGQKVKIEVIDGGYIYYENIVCPDPKEFISIYEMTNCPEDCYGNGHCSAGKCRCFDGFEPKTNCRTVDKLSSNGARFTNALAL